MKRKIRKTKKTKTTKKSKIRGAVKKVKKVLKKIVAAAQDNGEQNAENDFKTEEKLSGWKDLLATWTEGGKVARFKAKAYVRGLTNRIEKLGKKVGCNSLLIP